LNFRIFWALTKIVRATIFQYLENPKCSLSAQTWQLKSFFSCFVVKKWVFNEFELRARYLDQNFYSMQKTVCNYLLWFVRNRCQHIGGCSANAYISEAFGCVAWQLFFVWPHLLKRKWSLQLCTAQRVGKLGRIWVLSELHVIWNQLWVAQSSRHSSKVNF
jgi:hypothetical protein